MALQVESGKLVLYWNFGFPNGPQNKTIFNEDITKETNPLIIKVGIARNRHIVLATIKLKYVGLIKFEFIFVKQDYFKLQLRTEGNV